MTYIYNVKIATVMTYIKHKDSYSYDIYITELEIAIVIKYIKQR